VALFKVMPVVYLAVWHYMVIPLVLRPQSQLFTPGRSFGLLGHLH